MPPCIYFLFILILEYLTLARAFQQTRPGFFSSCKLLLAQPNSIDPVLTLRDMWHIASSVSMSCNWSITIYHSHQQTLKNTMLYILCLWWKWETSCREWDSNQHLWYSGPVCCHYTRWAPCCHHYAHANLSMQLLAWEVSADYYICPPGNVLLLMLTGTYIYMQWPCTYIYICIYIYRVVQQPYSM